MQNQLVDNFLVCASPPELQPEKVVKRRMGFVSQPPSHDRPPRSKLEVIAAVDYAFTPAVILGMFGYAYWSGQAMSDIQNEIMVAMGVATALRTTLFTKRAVARAKPEGGS